MQRSWYKVYVVASRQLRRLTTPLRIAALRVRSRAGDRLLVAAGVAVAGLLLTSVLGGSLVARESAVRRALESLSDKERAVSAAWFGVSTEESDYARDLDPVAEAALWPFPAERPIVRAMLFRQTRVEGILFDLAAIDDPEPWVKLRSGRLPRPCTPERCEVVQVGGESRGVPSTDELPLVLVGAGALTSELPLGRIAPPGAYGSLVETARTFASQTSPPFLLANGVAGATRLLVLSNTFRAYIWSVPLRPEGVHVWEVGKLLGLVAERRAYLVGESDHFDLTAPAEELAEASLRATVAGKRLFLVGGEVAALLLVFAALAAGGLRRDVDADWARLRQFGARSWQLWTLLVAEIGTVALVGAALGWIAGLGAAVGISRSAGISTPEVLDHSLITRSGLVLALSVWLASAAVVLAALRLPRLRVGRLALGLPEVAAVVALGVLLVTAFARGDVSAETLVSERRTDPLLILLPGLAAFALAVAVARAFGPLVRTLARSARGAPAHVRLALIALARRPDRAAMTVTFLVVSLALAFLAASYRATLHRAQSDQAAFQVPLDFAVREDLSKLVPVLQAAPPERYRELGTDVEVVPVIRRSAGVRTASFRPLAVEVLGIPAGALPTLEGWREDFSNSSVRELSRRLAPKTEIRLRGDAIPSDARSLFVQATGHPALVLVLEIETPLGDFVGVRLGRPAFGTHVLSAPLPEQARGGRVVGLALEQTGIAAETGEPVRGVLELGPLFAATKSGTRLVSRFEGWKGTGGAAFLERTAQGSRIRHFVTQAEVTRLRPRQPAEGRPIPAVVSPEVAAIAGPDRTFPVRFVGGRLNFLVVGIASFFPATAERADGFVIADRATLYTAANTGDPGSAFTNELWLGVPNETRAAEVEESLRKPPFSILEFESRLAIQRELRDDPLALGVFWTLAGGALIALLLAVLGMLLAVLSELRDERGELFDLEAQGMTPRALRRQLRLRAALVALLGFGGGVAAGLAVTALVVRLIALTANATTAVPPLVSVVDWRLALVGLGAAGFAAISGVLVATWAAFRAPAPGRHP